MRITALQRKVCMLWSRTAASGDSLPDEWTLLSGQGSALHRWSSCTVGFASDLHTGGVSLSQSTARSQNSVHLAEKISLPPSQLGPGTCPRHRGHQSDFNYAHLYVGIEKGLQLLPHTPRRHLSFAF